MCKKSRPNSVYVAQYMPDTQKKNLSLHQLRAVHERTHCGHCACSCLLHVNTPVAEPLIDEITPVWDRWLVLSFLCFLVGNTDGNETASCTVHLLVPRCKNNIFSDMPDETENLARDDLISRFEIEVV